jgi:meso-butanediol dehydrogenase / (S,S)-butanediol dehydrogenase / diacetyl reductase
MMFQDKVILVTGAAGGVGHAIARSFAAEGARVVICDVDRQAGETLALELGEQGFLVSGDVSDPEICDAMVRSSVDHFGGLDVLVNGAGVIHVGDAAGTSAAQWRQVLGVNLDGAFYMSRAAMPHLIASGGAIVNVGSDFSLVGGEQLVAYCASKGGMLLMTKAMALDHAKQGVRINIVCPTVIDTPMVDSLARQLGNPADEQRQIYDASVPTGRMIAPQEVADSVLFLASDKASHITGTSLVIDGGVTAR